MLIRVEKIFVSKDKDWAIVLKVYFKDSIHYILNSYLDVSPQQEPFVDGNVEINWQSRFGVVKVKNNKIVKQEWIKGNMEGFRHYFLSSFVLDNLKELVNSNIWLNQK